MRPVLLQRAESIFDRELFRGEGPRKGHGNSSLPPAPRFARREFLPPDSAEALAKAELARKIAELIAKRRLTQAAAAELLNIDQPKVSALVRGRLDGFSLDRLVRFLVLLGSDEIVVKPRTRATGQARVLVA